MRRYIALFTALVFSSLLAGCASANSPDITVQTRPIENHTNQIPADVPKDFAEDRNPFVPDDLNGQKPMNPDFAMDGNKPGETAFTPVVIEGDDLFSSRDLDTNPDLSDAVSITAQDDSEYTIRSAGIYVLTGQAANYTVKVEADKEDKVQIVLDSVTVSNDDFPVIYVKSADKCFVSSFGDNALSVSKKYVSDGDTNTDAVIFSREDLTLNGTGTLTILSAAGNGITSKDDMKITGGNYNITSALDAIEANDAISVYDGEFIINTNKDGLHCENDDQQGSIYIKDGSFTIAASDDGIQATTTLVIDGGAFNITASEGLEATYVQINDGTIHINASDDGINASGKSNEYDVVIEINGGEITIVMGPGDTDGLDANGTIIVNGGTVDVTGRSTFDADRGSVYNGGTVIINGTVVDSIPSSMMGGHGGNKGDWFPGGNGDRMKRH